MSTAIDAPATKTATTENISHLDFGREEFEVIQITPAIAQGWLDMDSDRTHKLNKKSAQRIKTDIVNGDWILTGDPVKFDANGNLIDGRARLAAIVGANQTVTAAVAYGVSRQARDSIDTGASWTAKKMLEDDGHVNANRLAPALLAIQEWERGHHTAYPSSEAITNSTTRRFLVEHPEVIRLANEAASFGASNPQVGQALTFKQLVKLFWAFDKVSNTDRVAFFNQVALGNNLTVDSPIYLLRETLERQRDAKKKGSSTDPAPGRKMLAVTIKAFNAYREGRTMKVLSFVAGGSKPEEFPLPK